MATRRWYPFREMQSFRESMERIFDEGFRRPARSMLMSTRGSVPLNVVEREDEFVVHAMLPGARPDDVQVTLRGNLLTIQGQYPLDERGPGDRWLLRERRGNPFYRTIALPEEVDADHTSARFRQGVLELALPKTQVARARHIKVQSASATPGERTSANGTGDSPPRANGAPAAKGNGGSATPAVSTRGAAQRQPRASADRRETREPSDSVTEASEESFPASDPPSWTRADAD